MANRHEELKWEVIADWTKNGRGRLFCMNQGLAFPARVENGETRPAQYPIWFGPLKRKFKGFPDLFGWEYVVPYGFDLSLDSAIKSGLAAPWFCTVEVKTKNDTIKKDQKRIMNRFSASGIRCYVAKETGDGYTLSNWPECILQNNRLETI